MLGDCSGKEPTTPVSCFSTPAGPFWLRLATGAEQLATSKASNDVLRANVTPICNRRPFASIDPLISTSSPFEFWPSPLTITGWAINFCLRPKDVYF
jgi:hypothetical protein